MVRYIDISVPTSERTTVFPGDPSPQIQWPYWAQHRGDPANVGFFSGGLHHGTHVDSPWHFIENGRRLHEMPLEHWLGPCHVVDLTTQQACIDAAALEAAGIPEDARRLLFKTRNGFTDYWYEPWNPDFIFIHESAARWCVSRKLLTIGLDYLTIDSPREPSFPAHLELLGNEVLIIENINLRDIEPGEYELLAAPVNLQNCDGGWCRAILRTED